MVWLGYLVDLQCLSKPQPVFLFGHRIHALIHESKVLACPDPCGFDGGFLLVWGQASGPDERRHQDPGGAGSGPHSIGSSTACIFHKCPCKIRGRDGGLSAGGRRGRETGQPICSFAGWGRVSRNRHAQTSARAGRTGRTHGQDARAGRTGKNRSRCRGSEHPALQSPFWRQSRGVEC
jgi:hypothetical protein